jgi:threonine synthase
LAALDKLKDLKLPIVCLLTGSGLKDVDAVLEKKKI